VIDEIEVFLASVNDPSELLGHIAKLGQTAGRLVSAVDSMKLTLRLASALGFEEKVKIHALKLQQHRFKDGIAFEVAWGSRRTDILAAGGRYDHLLRESGIPSTKASEPVRAVAVQIALDKISSSLANYQSRVVANLVKEQRSFGFWSPKRCDAYIISHVPGQLESRLELAALLWAQGISADLMYESGIEDGADAIQELCIKEGILFIIWTRPKSNRTNHTGIKVVNTLTRAEHEVSRSELVPLLQHQLREQKQADGATIGLDQGLRPGSISTREPGTSDNVHLSLPLDRKHPKHNKKIMLDKGNWIDYGMPVCSC